jgi:hypothetical protein
VALRSARIKQDNQTETIPNRNAPINPKRPPCCLCRASIKRECASQATTNRPEPGGRVHRSRPFALQHAWFEDRGPPCTLLAFVDDATRRLMQLRFVTSESAMDYFRTTRAYLEAHGKPVAFYSDKHGIFRVNSKEAAGGDGITQFGRALLALNIDIICANSPQAKGPGWPGRVTSEGRVTSAA